MKVMKQKQVRAKKPFKVVKVDSNDIEEAIKKARKNEAKWKWIGRANQDELEDVDLSVNNVSH